MKPAFLSEEQVLLVTCDSTLRKDYLAMLRWGVMLALVALVGRSVEVDAARQEITDLEDR